MKLSVLLRRCLCWLLLPVALAAPQAAARTDEPFRTSPTLTREITALIRLLEEVHYNHESVRPDDYGQVVPDFMAELDAPRLFFLAGDVDEFSKRYPAKWLYNNISLLGKIDAAYDIYKAYEERAQKRIRWIMEELAKDVDLDAAETYAIDRSKPKWSTTEQEIDVLWRKRLKFEILQEVLNKKPLEEAKVNVRKRYERRLKDLEEVEGEEVAEWFLSTITRLYDPHSTYFSPETFEDFGIQMRLQLVGIGALLGIEDDYCVIKEVVTGGPADLSKQLNSNDKIISVGQDTGEPVEIIGMKLRKIVDLIRGQKDTRVRLVIQPADATDPSVRREIVLTRDVIHLDSARARAAIFDVPNGETGKRASIGVITLPAFYGPDGSSQEGDKTSATADVAELLSRLQSTGIDGLVLDLRNNGGGLLSEAIDLTGLFISEGPVVQVKSYYGDVKIDNDENPRISYSGPMAVLVSRFSASASEIVAGALQNYGRAVVIGDSSTHGKGTVQTVIEMKNVLSDLARSPVKTGATKLTVQKFYRPDGHSTQLLGVVPDIILPSIDEFLPVGEKELPHALVWDKISSSTFDGRPLDIKTLTPLREASQERQAALPEFVYLKRYIDWFKQKQEQKEISLRLEERRQQKATDTAFRKSMDHEKDVLAKNEYSFREFNLGAPRKKPEKKAPAKDDPEDEISLSSQDDDGYGRFDITLREALRVVTDAVELGTKPDQWTSGRAPLTAQVSRVAR